jgi:hypothetical protein
MEKALYISDTLVKNSSGFSGKHTALQAGLLTTEVTRMRQRLFNRKRSFIENLGRICLKHMISLIVLYIHI